MAEEKFNKIRRRQLTQFLALVIASTLLIAGIWILELVQKSYYLNKLKDKVGVHEGGVSEVQRKINVVRFFENEYSKKVFVSDVMHELQTINARRNIIS